MIADVVAVLRAQFDSRWGGFGGAPKFPQASMLELLLRAGALDLVAATLDGMAAGGMYDLVGGGFHRYSVDDEWLVPHFEKMLYDNALLVPALPARVGRHREVRYRRVVEETVEYALRELRLDGGGFASAQDADTEGVEGLTFTWTPSELTEAIGPGRDDLLQPFEHGRYVLRGELAGRAGARSCSRYASGARSRCATTRRSPRWNGLMLAALAESGRRLERGIGSPPHGSLRLPARAALGRRTGCTGRGATASRRGPATSRTTRTSRTG